MASGALATRIVLEGPRLAASRARSYEVETASEVLATGAFAYVPKPCEYISFEHIVGLVPAAAFQVV